MAGVGTRTVGLIGRGAIGGPIATALNARAIPGCEFGGTLGRDATRADVESLCSRCDVVVEAASQEVVREYGPVVTAAGADLLVMSVGALIDEAVRARLGHGSGRVLVSSGAIGGVDILRAASLLAPFDHVTLRTTKQPVALERPWMTRDLQDRLRAGKEAITLFEGPAMQAIERFPASVNVAATIGFATVGVERLAVTVVADPNAAQVEHRVIAEGPAGTYELRIRNAPSPDNPRTSAVTPFAAIRALGDLGSTLVWGV